MTELRFGVMNFTRSPYDELSHRIRDAEAMGFDSAWVDDDILTPGYVDLEAWTLLGALARDTSRIQIGTMVTVTSFRNPAILASQVLTVDRISGGRVEFGFGAGGPPNNYAALGLHDWTPGERADRLDEQAAIIGAMLRGERVDFQGKHYQIEGAQAGVPVQKPRPPFVIAAHGERGLRTVARYADGWNTLGGQPYPAAQDPSKRLTLAESIASTRRLTERLRVICEEERRDFSTIRRSIMVYRTLDDPLSSLGAFDEYVGGYRELGIEEIIFYWPPQDNVFPKDSDTAKAPFTFGVSKPLSSQQTAMFEHIVAERISNRA
jgi:alkanesulfonate monooxygenase SsuD/methylene tetrahydromethanopterin reductase-like flavin-dependent oxidoreductase (luciferase family)